MHTKIVIPLVYRTSGEIDSPEKKARVAAARGRFDDIVADLNEQRFGATRLPELPRADEPTTLPLPLVYVRIKEGSRESTRHAPRPQRGPDDDVSRSVAGRGTVIHVGGGLAAARAPPDDRRDVL